MTFVLLCVLQTHEMFFILGLRVTLHCCSPEGKLDPQTPAPRSQPEVCPSWMGQMWNVSPLLFSFLLFSCFRSHYLCTYLFCVLLPPEVTLALLDAANDKDADVQEQVRKSMLTLGKQQPDRVLSMCQDYLLKHPKVTFMNIFPILSITYFLH